MEAQKLYVKFSTTFTYVERDRKPQKNVSTMYMSCNSEATGRCVIMNLTTVAMASYCLADTPQLPQLQSFTTKEGKSVNVFEMIGVSYASFGTCLLNDAHGHKINNIENDHYLVMDKIRAILTTWLKGRYIRLP